MNLKKLQVKTLLLAAGLSMGAESVWGQAPFNHTYSVSDGVTVETAVGQGYGYFLYNEGAGKFLTGGRGWGAYATADHAGKIVELTTTSEGKYKIHSKHYSANNGVGALEGYLHSGLYADNNDGLETDLTWTFAKVGDENKYTIYNTALGKYLYYGTNTELALGESVDNANYYWIIVPKTIRDAAGDFTYYLQNQGFNRPWERQVWNDISGNENNQKGEEDGWAWPIYNLSWNSVNPCAEKYHATFKLYQTIDETVPKGKYKVYAQAFYRQDLDGTGAGPTLYANDDNATLRLLNYDSNNTTESMDGASDAFNKGEYPNEVETIVTNGSLQVGINITQSDQWVIWDNFVIDYVDPYVSVIAEEFTNGGTMTADQWYSYNISIAGTYNFTAGSAIGNVICTSSDQLKTAAEALEAMSSASVALSAGTIYFKSSSTQTLTVSLDKSSFIAENKGDITSLINGDFETDASGWTGGSRVTGLTRSWRGSDANAFYECNYTNNMTYTLSNMPAGSYKVIAAARAWDGVVKAQLGGVDGSSITGVGDMASSGNMEINTNGVEMPYSSLGGFTTDDNGHNWRWISAEATLAETGNLVINFAATSNSSEWRWMAIDDVHLYCTSLGGTSYTTTVVEGSDVSNSDGKVVTCDIILSNPNTIVTSSAAITTAAGETMNNNLVGSNIAQMILYDGADYTFSMTEGNYTINNSYGAAKFYRQLTGDQFCTVCLPFTPAIGTGTYYTPTSFENGTLTFTEVADADLKPNTPYILKPSGSYTDLWNNNNADNSDKYNVVYSGVRTSTNVSNGALYFTGTYEKIANIGAWTGTYYVLGTDNNLHKVAGSVSVNPFRAYFFVSEPANSARDVINLKFEDEQTGVQSIKDTTSLSGGAVYNLSGQRVEKPAKGLYIVNGKKTVIK